MSVSLVDVSVSDASVLEVTTMGKGAVVSNQYRKVTGKPTQTSVPTNAPTPWLDLKELRNKVMLAGRDIESYENCLLHTQQAIGYVKAWLAMWTAKYGTDAPLAFGLEWRYLRTCISLQVRLLVEQVLYERGGGWRQFVSGFKPLD